MSDGIWTVERLVPGGDGLARCPDGRVAFVPGGLPGDRILPLRLRERPRHVHVLSWELVEPGPDRVEPPCPLGGRCGGCDWMCLAVPAQRRAKARLLEDALRRIGKLEAQVAAPEPIGPDLGYRTRLRLHGDRGRLGLFERSSRRLVPLDACPVSAPPIEEALALLGRRLPRGLPGVVDLELRTAPLGDPVIAVCTTDRLPRIGRELLGRLAQDLPVVIDGTPLGREPDQRWPLTDSLELRVPATGFVQVNLAVNRALVAAVVEGAHRRGARTFVDLYCGAGNFSLPLLVEGLTGVGVEASEDACRSADSGAREAGLPGRFLAGDVPAVLPELDAPDLLVLDPPRTGARDALPAILALAPATVAYVSCDPATLARDLRELVAGGYDLEEVRAFDMFPHTHHVEALAWLSRSC